MDTKKKYYPMLKWAKELFPLCRSITGKGLRDTISFLRKINPELKVLSFRSGEKVLDWHIPNEWNINNAFIQHTSGKKYAQFSKSNLHVVGYSIPVNKWVFKSELIKHIYTQKNFPSAVPYVTSFYEKNWGFCLSENEKRKLPNGKFKVFIDSNLQPGVLNLAEAKLKGKSEKEIFFSTNICHPSMANNELSGPIVSMALIKYFMKKKLNKTMRFIFIPETIGSLAYLSKKLKILKKNVIGGFNLTCIGDDRNHSCMLSRNENSQSDKAIIQCYKKLKIKHKIFSYLERGSDERQFNSPYVDLGITSIFRTKYGEYPEYHTSLDSFGHVVTKRGLNGGFKVAKKSIEILQKKIIPKSMIVCEPQFGRRGLYKKFSIEKKKNQARDLINFMTFSDGTNDLEDISKKLRISYNKSKFYLNILLKHNLIFC